MKRFSLVFLFFTIPAFGQSDKQCADLKSSIKELVSVNQQFKDRELSSEAFLFNVKVFGFNQAVAKVDEANKQYLIIDKQVVGWLNYYQYFCNDKEEIK